MYEAIRGCLIEKEPLKAVVETGGISYRLSIPLSTYSRLPAAGKEVHLFLSQVVREDAHTLFAFFLKEERDLFEVLIALSGVGPRTAVAIIGHVDMKSFHQAITSADTRILGKIPGVGKKTAERLVVEMRDKIKGKSKGALLPPPSMGISIAADAVSALMNLGYHPVDAQKAVQKAAAKCEDDLGQLISEALRNF